MSWGIFIAVLISSIVFLFVCVLVVLKYIWINNSSVREHFIRLCIVFFTLVLSFLCLEIYFRFFVIQSGNSSVSLSAKLWLKKYWYPINSYGYRDIEHPVAGLNGKKVIFVVGDSFAAGDGIRNYKDRFSNILQDKLGGRWVVITIARRGWATQEEFQAILSYPYRPDVIVLSYVLNDIEISAEKNGLKRLLLSLYKPYITVPHYIESLCKVSYFLNYIYNHVCHIAYVYRPGKSKNNPYKEYLSSAYLDGKIWHEQENAFYDIINYARDLNIKLFVIIFPNLRDNMSSEGFTSLVSNFFKTNNIPVFDLTEMFSGYKRNDLVVSGIDQHPSIKVHRLVGELLVDYFNRVQN